MAKTIAELRKELAAKENRVRKLQAQRAGPAKTLKAIDGEIAALTGVPAAPKRLVKKATVKKPRKRTVKQRRARKPLVEYIKQVLAESKVGLRIKEIEAAVRKVGYKTASRHFYTSVAATIRKSGLFRKVRRGVYVLKAGKKGTANKVQEATRKAANKAPAKKVLKKIVKKNVPPVKAAKKGQPA